MTNERVILDRPHFASSHEVNVLYALLDRADRLVPRDDWCREDNGMLTVYDKHLSHEAIKPDPPLRLQTGGEVLDQVVDRIVAAISETYEELLVADTVLMTKMRPGSQHTAHADAELADGSPNHTPQRTHVGLLYLRLPIKGGVLSVWDQVGDAASQTFTADPGRLVAFPATRHYFHQVTPVEEGERWGLSVWTKA